MTVKKDDLAPKPGKVLYENLFGQCDTNETLDRISKGLAAVAQNAEWLFEDAQLLAASERYARARFLVATTHEEIAKSYILLDMCRVDFRRNEDLLRRLCMAFYNHVDKHAYYNVVRYSDFVYDLKKARDRFQHQRVRWFPAASIENGEPDMPHETYFTRQANLYVDFDDYSQDWYLPSPEDSRYAFEKEFGDDDQLSLTRGILDRLLSTRDHGLYKPEALAILNRVFKGERITEQTSNEELFGLYGKVAEGIESELGISRHTFGHSALREWPLYHFLQPGP